MHRMKSFKLLQLVLILIGLSIITSCGKQGVISAKKDTEEMVSETSQSPVYYTETYVELEGGTGKATISSPAEIIYKDDMPYVKIVWSSKHYDYMRLGTEKYLNENEGGNSTFTIPVEDFSKPLEIVADTVAMSMPHEIEYTLKFSFEENEEENNSVIQTKPVTESIDIGIAGESLELLYANQFSVTKYDDYYLIAIKNDASYLVVPEGKEVPANIPEDIVILKQPLNKTYLVSTSVMDLVRQCDALDNIILSGTKASDWYIDEAKSAMQSGKISYAGKYSAPDYEMILGSGCNLAIENTMIYHKPEVKAKLEELGIPVLVEKSSYEAHPLGRLEWIKLYGILYGAEDKAEHFFNEAAEHASKIMGSSTDKSVAFFYITAGGMVNARLSTDYIAKMIEMSGGTYCLNSDKKADSSVATINMQMEEFYVAAKDADILIYNSTIGGEIKNIDELIEKNILFRDFKAVNDGEVYCTSRDFFQESTGTVMFMQDLNRVYSGETDNLTYLEKLR